MGSGVGGRLWGVGGRRRRRRRRRRTCRAPTQWCCPELGFLLLSAAKPLLPLKEKGGVLVSYLPDDPLANQPPPLPPPAQQLQLWDGHRGPG